MTTHAFDYLNSNSTDLPSVCALVGDDRFLKRLSLTRLSETLTEDGDAVEFDSKTPWRDVNDELSTLSLFGGGQRLVVVQSADDFVKANRPQLESLVTNPSPAGTLILDLKSLASNTRLFRSIDETGGIIECAAPQAKRGKSSYLDENRLCEWLREWGKSTHNVELKRGADEELLGLVGPELGLLDQELAKLALFCDAGGEVSVDLVRKVVGGWRAKTTWDLLDAALDGNAAEALLQLERLLPIWRGSANDLGWPALVITSICRCGQLDNGSGSKRAKDFAWDGVGASWI